MIPTTVSQSPTFLAVKSQAISQVVLELTYIQGSESVNTKVWLTSVLLKLLLSVTTSVWALVVRKMAIDPVQEIWEDKMEAGAIFSLMGWLWMSMTGIPFLIIRPNDELFEQIDIMYSLKLFFSLMVRVSPSLKQSLFSGVAGIIIESYPTWFATIQLTSSQGLFLIASMLKPSCCEYWFLKRTVFTPFYTQISQYRLSPTIRQRELLRETRYLHCFSASTVKFIQPQLYLTTVSQQVGRSMLPSRYSLGWQFDSGSMLILQPCCENTQSMALRWEKQLMLKVYSSSQITFRGRVSWNVLVEMQPIPFRKQSKLYSTLKLGQRDTAIRQQLLMDLQFLLPRTVQSIVRRLTLLKGLPECCPSCSYGVGKEQLFMFIEDSFRFTILQYILNCSAYEQIKKELNYDQLVRAQMYFLGQSPKVIGTGLHYISCIPEASRKSDISPPNGMVAFIVTLHGQVLQ